jgi:uncharacterized membrane protein YvbJ
MLCPSCGMNNSDDSPQCSNCGYKFRFGYAYNDPKRMTFINLLKSNTKKSKIRGYLFISIALIILVLIILSWLKSI